MIKKVFKIYLILSCLDHICITTQSQEEESGCAVYFNLFRWATGRFLLFLRLFFATSGPCRKAYVKYKKKVYCFGVILLWLSLEMNEVFRTEKKY